MTIQYKLASQVVNFDRDQFSATAVYHLFDDASALLTVGGIVADSGLTTLLGSGAGSAYQSFGTGYLASTTYPKLRYAGYTLQNDEGGAKWTLTVNFDSAQSSYSPSAVAKDTVPENQPGFTAIEMGIKAASVPTWRSGATQPASDALRDYPSEIDIAGTAVDQAGEPVDKFVNVLTFTVRNVISGRPSNWSTIAYHTNTRNDAAFSIAGFTAATGTLLFIGAQVSRVGPNAYEVAYSFAYDDMFHLRQVPKVDSTGKTVLGIISGASLTTTAATLDANPDHPRYAGIVFWKQPFPSRTDFAALNISGLT